MRSIAARLGRSPSTISRELGRNAEAPGGTGRRRRTRWPMSVRARPKPAKLATNLALRGKVEQDLQKRYSPEQIAGRLRRGVPRRSGDVGVDRDDLPVAVRAVARRAAPRADPLSAHRAGAAPARPPGRAAQEPDPEHGQHQRAPGRSRPTGRARPLGGRPDHRQAQPDRDRHAGRAHQRLHDAGARCPTATSPSRSRRRWPRRSRPCPRRLRRIADLGPGPGDARLEAGRASPPASTSSSATRTRPGSAAPTRTPTACSASTSPRAPTSSVHSEAELDAVADELNDRPRKRLGYRKPIEEIGHLFAA